MCLRTLQRRMDYLTCSCRRRFPRGGKTHVQTGALIPHAALLMVASRWITTDHHELANAMTWNPLVKSSNDSDEREACHRVRSSQPPVKVSSRTRTGFLSTNKRPSSHPRITHLPCPIRQIQSMDRKHLGMMPHRTRHHRVIDSTINTVAVYYLY